ncbi:MAG: hypothetical protein IPJ61_06595 [Tessaracoccus sp.]|uniref:hypothetical protein n=1 Tax=Tessaracoccus sp. TaxID=1971211 RepID=UPI001ECEB65E|nr:hypothetical protein [Tessaracoccus sp.]MBK7820739.1 hypothetical protein [Tessaracoccus sp.]
MTGVGWHSGRALWMPLMAFALGVAVLYPFLYVSFTGPWAPFEAPRWVTLLEVASIGGGTAGLYGIAPQLAWVERQSPRAIWARDAAAAAVVMAVFAALPLAVRWLWGLSDVYRWFLPPDRQDWMTPDLVASTFTYDTLAAWGLNIAAVLALACLTTRVVGPLLGPASAALWFVGLLVAQGYGRWPILTRADEAAPTFTAPDAALLATLIAAGALAYAFPVRLARRTL